MKKNIIKIGLVVSAIGLASILTGCGSSSPEDVAKDYVSNSAEGNFDESAIILPLPSRDICQPSSITIYS